MRNLKLSWPRFPHARVRVAETDGNSFAILGAVKEAMRKAGASTADQTAFVNEAVAGDYKNLLAVCREWVTFD